MGNYNSGGHNRTHGRVEEYSRIDSFGLLRHADWLEPLTDDYEVNYPIMDGNISCNLLEDTATVSHNGRSYPLGLSKVPNVDGISYRLYFLCQKCGKRARHLYKEGRLYQCRKCARLNYGIQQRSGLSLLRRKMYWLVVKKLQYVDWEIDHPDLCIQDLWHIPKPRYMRWKKYEALMEEYRRLQKEYDTMYNGSLMKAFGRIQKLLGYR